MKVEFEQEAIFSPRLSEEDNFWSNTALQHCIFFKKSWGQTKQEFKEVSVCHKKNYYYPHNTNIYYLNWAISLKAVYAYATS